MAKLISYKYNVLTLEGELIRPQGAISGGNRKTKQILINPEKEVETLKHQINEKLKKYDELNQTLNQLNNKLDEINEIINENQSSIGASKRQIEILDQDKSKLKNEYQLLTSKNIDESEVAESKDVIGILEQINHKEILKTEVEQQLNVARSLKEKQLTHLNELNNAISEKRHYTGVLLEKVVKLNTDITMLNSKIQQDLSRLTEEYHMTYDHAKTLELKSIENEDEIREEIKELRSELATIGNVNLDAIQEYQEEYERYSFMKNEYDDINNAVKNLLSSIDEMDSLMEEQFDKTIKEVNQALPSTFEVLFGGGTAKIIYTEPDNILETGIDIKISPPGKNINNLNLLSGGEKSLVALSVLFAILKVRPIPLVILDEAEAPLDPANVERFAKYIRTFVNTTQFIIVTHRVGTMEHCDVLYGATMQQKGVTKIVGIKLKQAEEMIAQNKK
ncbi:hypothetical protein P344_05895 [Spiroplasma mirum ATCC 29335]|uniref:RecF/RecN/SMC N-terminal domain-containing protein n=1 Tax=Spiroplasma mirum ATCC 29335 TaxID=838561 RepID=W6AN80_9MOLU|nr:hypothetical protein [Spiroplasma mirum]AHI58486.1 hypothetical protein P344_05895 [Spiroplasma mirum ATCC 29335]